MAFEAPQEEPTPENGLPPECRRADLNSEIQVQTDWARLLDAEAPISQLEQVGEHQVWLVQGLFSAAECTRLLTAAEGHGFGTTNYPKEYRGNLRLTTMDSGLADAVWSRLQPLVPETLTLDTTPRYNSRGRLRPRGRAENLEEWAACGLNECWRLAKYHPGDRFHGHCDADFQRSNSECSMLTVNIYMNEGFDGGATRFYFENKRTADVVVTPKAGLCLLFRQPPEKLYYHDGQELASGLKYLFRSDVMYRRQRP
mmetsp:Transcript_23744/g.74748  ORF Transcript_23744/g.74748 Transcript_23744/m.74748 type:complete len:256 (+) Transcript_23744:101-868(+)